MKSSREITISPSLMGYVSLMLVFSVSPFSHEVAIFFEFLSLMFFTVAVIISLRAMYAGSFEKNNTGSKVKKLFKRGLIELIIALPGFIFVLSFIFLPAVMDWLSY